MKKIVTVVGMIMFTLTLGACNTMKGMGKDVERGGEKVQEKATEVQTGAPK